MSLWIPWEQADRLGRLLLLAALGFTTWALRRALAKPVEPADEHGQLPLDKVAAQALLLWLSLLVWNAFAELDFTERLLNGLALLLSAWFAAALGLRLLGRIRKAHWFYDWSWSGFSAVWLALIIRATLVEAYSIPSESMVPTLLISDHLFVSKTTYGWHVPFTQGRKLKYRDVKRGEIVIFIPPHVKQSYVKRCVGLPGDSVEVRGKRVFINGEPAEVPYSYGRLERVPEGSRAQLLDARDRYLAERLPVLQALQAQGRQAQAQAESQRTTWIGPLSTADGTYYLEASAVFQRVYGRLTDTPKVGELELWPKEASAPVAPGHQDWARERGLGNRDWFGPYTLQAGEYWMMGDNRDNSSDSRFFGPVREEALRGTPLVRYWPIARAGRIR
jgi:signal peptidase I